MAGEIGDEDVSGRQAGVDTALVLSSVQRYAVITVIGVAVEQRHIDAGVRVEAVGVATRVKDADALGEDVRTKGWVKGPEGTAFERDVAKSEAI